MNYDQCILLGVVHNMRGSGKETNVMDSAPRNGQTVPSMKANGCLTRPVVKVNSSMWTETFSKESGEMIKQTGLVFILT